MMMSPEGYYESNLKGKSAAKIMKCIRNLKKDIRRLKNIMAQPNYGELVTHPDESTRLWCKRQYLKKAIEAYVKAGGIYKPSQRELKAARFEERISDIHKVVFTIGGFFGGFKTRTFTSDGEYVHIDIQHSLKPPEPVLLPEDEEELLTKASFIEGIRRLHIGEWEKEYVDPNVLDGESWKLEIFYINGHKPVRISGLNAYPYNFNDLATLFEITLKNLYP